jgi:hypothetical protein
VLCALSTKANWPSFSPFKLPVITRFIGFEGVKNRLTDEVTHQIDVTSITYQRLFIQRMCPTKCADSLVTKNPKDAFFILLKDDIAVELHYLTGSKLVHR